MLGGRFIVGPHYFAIFDQVGLALGHAQSLRDTKRFNDRALVIGNEGERQMIFVFEEPVSVMPVTAGAVSPTLRGSADAKEVIAKAARAARTGSFISRKLTVLHRTRKLRRELVGNEGLTAD